MSEMPSAESGPGLDARRWWISDGPVDQGGEKILGPFESRELALRVRSYFEDHGDANGLTYWVSQEPLRVLHSAEEPARALTEHLTSDETVGQVARAISDAQTHGHVEYKRRVGYQGRLTIARAVLDAVCEALEIPTSIDLLMDPPTRVTLPARGATP